MPKSPSPSPKRRPLHERSDSQTNYAGMSAPSIRMVADSDDEDFDEDERALQQEEEEQQRRRVYQADPFPSQPAHILSPRTRRVAGRSSGTGPTSSVLEADEGPSTPTAETVVPPLVYDSSAFAAVALDPSLTSSTTSKPPPSPPPRSPKRISPTQQEAFKDEPPADSASSATASLEPAISKTQGTASKGASVASKSPSLSPVSTQAPTIAVTDSTQEGAGSHEPDPDPRGRRTISVTSSASSETLQGPRHRDRSVPSSTPSPFLPLSPTLSRKSGTLTPPLPTNPRPSDYPEPLQVPSSPRIRHGQRSPSSRSIPGQATQEPAEFGTAVIQYPLVKAPSSQSSWADSSIYIPKKRRMPDRDSAVPLRLNPVTPAVDPIVPLQGAKDIGDGFLVPLQQTPSSSMAVEPSSGSSSDPPRRTKGKGVARNWSYRDPALQDTSTDSGTDRRPLRRKAPFGRSSLDPNQPQNAYLGRPTSLRTRKRMSNYPTISQYLRDAAHRNGVEEESGQEGSAIVKRSLAVPSSGAPGSSTEDPTDSSSPRGSPIHDNMPLSIFRPRSRSRKSLASAPIPERDELILPIPNTTTTTAAPSILDRRERVRYSEPAWSPRLQHDRRATMISIWEAPRVENRTDGGLLTRSNIQLVFFCFGFLFPLGQFLLCSRFISLM